MSEGGPDWVSDALRQARDELRLFLRTAVDFSLHPGRFAEDWASGRRRALNPLGFLATALAVVGPARLVTLALVHLHDDEPSLIGSALGALLPFAYYLALGVLQHGVLRLIGSRRPLRDNCAMALYAGGGPATATNLVFMALVVLRARLLHDVNGAQLNAHVELALSLGAVTVFTIFWTTLSTAVVGLHRLNGIHPWHILVANCVAMSVTGLLFALFDPPGEYGLHLVFGPMHHDGHWQFVCGIYG